MSLKEQTLAHYDRLLACTSAAEFEGEGWKSNSCPLCAQFIERVESCDGCPVQVRTDRYYCRTTPWHEMNDRLRMYCESGGVGVTLVYVREAIQKDRDFLESLDYGDEPVSCPGAGGV